MFIRVTRDTRIAHLARFVKCPIVYVSTCEYHVYLGGYTPDYVAFQVLLSPPLRKQNTYLSTVSQTYTLLGNGAIYDPNGGAPWGG